MMDFQNSQMALHTFSHEMYMIREALTAPHVMLRPEIFPDGESWCCLLGKDLMSGVAGFGDTPEQAATAFDVAWRTQTLAKKVAS